MRAPRSFRTAPLVLTIVLASLLVPGAPLAADKTCNVPGKKANLNFTLQDVNGKPVRLSQYRGRVVLVNFWATWCGPCRVEIPWLIDLYREHRARGLVVLGVSVDAEVPRVKPFARELKINYPVLIGAGRDDVSAAFGPFRGFPTSVLVARDGTICVRHVGIATKAQLEREITALL
jgi:thiol-disulfide isomerase/thioredoxin